MFGLESGGAIAPNIAQEKDDLTSGQRSSSSVYRSGAEPGTSILGRANLASMGMVLWGALGGKAVTGASAPYTHTFKLANTLPSFTLFEIIPDGAGIDVPRLAGAKVDSLELSWTGNGPLKVSASYKGRALSFGASGTASVTDETSLTTNFIPAGGTFKLSVDSGTPATALIKSGTITLTNKLVQQQYSGTITPGAVDAGWHDAICTFVLVPDDIDLWRTTVTGTSSGAGIANAPVYGSFEHIFKSQGGTAAHQLKLSAAKVGFMPEAVEAQAQGGAWEADFGGEIVNDGPNGTVVVELTNATATYAAP